MTPTDHICFGCAAMYGAKWPDSLDPDYLEGNCDNCNTYAPLGLISDWEWPKGIPKKWKTKC